MQRRLLGGFALYSWRRDAEAVFAAPDAHLPFLGDAVEAWHALVIPYTHRGSVKWRDTVETDSAIKVAAAAPKGPLVVITSASYDNPGPHEKQRMLTFFKGVVDVVDHYRTLDGNRRAEVFSAAPVDGREGCTMSLWNSDQEMMAAAYKSGEHKKQLDYHKKTPHFDRSSFTRGRIAASKGTWDGADPVSEMT